MDEIKAKQQVVEKIREAENILVTVSDSPSVDALSAALGLSLLLDGQKKYATAIFSGETPPAIAFLEPEKTFDDTTDSLRDFIIALNKEKADHLRYKVEGDSVKIFITPYKTVITSDDLEYSQGDYNVELVIALGVDNQESLDEALDNHGKILHDAAIITITAGEQTSNLGGIDWHEGGASSLSEMIVGLAEALKEDKKKSLLDGPIATALLTGIVAETDRFSNEHTTSKAMTVAATLMAAGADQQLIATELQNAEEIGAPAPVEDEPAEDNDSSDNDESSEVSADGTMTITEHKPKEGLSIDHTETLAELDERVLGEEGAQDKIDEELEVIERDKEKAIEAAREMAAINEEAKIQRDKEALVDHTANTTAAAGTAYAAAPESLEPSFGGTLNATTEEAEDEARREEASDQNKTILSHSYLGGGSPAETANQSVSATAPVNPAPGSIGFEEIAPSENGNNQAESAPVLNAQTFVASGERVIQPLADQAAPTAAQSVLPPLVDEPSANAYGVATPSLSDSLASTVEAAPVAPMPAAPADLGLPLPPPLPDFSQGSPMPPAIPLPQTEQPAILGDILNQDSGEVVVDPTANAVAAAGSAYAFEETPAPVPGPAPAPASPADPAQYQIPTQQ